jgi:DNA polymerase V
VPVVAHLDADAFYCSAERVRHEDLVGVPVGVLGNQGACVIAKSYEMKACGVKTGEPIWDAKVKCPDGVYVKRDFRWYEVLSRAMLDVVNRFSPTAEYYSIDEFFFAVHGDPANQARRIQTAILSEVRVPVTIGISRTRTLAKLFSDTAKPFGIRVATGPDEEDALMAAMPVTEVSGIGSRRAARLAVHGIQTCRDFARADRRLIRSLLTKTGEDLWWELNGQPATPIRPERTAHKFLSRGGSIGGPSADPNVLRGWLARNVERLVEELEFHDVKPGKLDLSLAFAPDGGASARCPLSGNTDRFDLLLEAASIGLSRCWRPGLVVTHMHLVAGDLRQPGFVQPGLFDAPPEPAERLARVKAEVGRKIGRWVVRSGATLHLPQIYRDKSNEFEVCDIRGKYCF